MLPGRKSSKTRFRVMWLVVMTIEILQFIYNMYREDAVSVHRACFEQATQPYSLGGEGTICLDSRPTGYHT